MKSFNNPALTLTSSSTMTADITTGSIDCLNLNTWSMQFVWTGTPVGTVSVQASDDGSTWTEVASSSQATSGAAGNHRVNASGFGGRYIRGKFAFTSGTGTLAVSVTAKGAA